MKLKEYVGPTAPNAVADYYCERLRETFFPCAVAVIAKTPNGVRRVISNAGYPESTIGYLLKDFVLRDPGYYRVRAEPKQFVCWDDVPGYRAGRSAREIFEPAGFVQGTTKILQADGLVGEMHINLGHPSFTSSMKEHIHEQSVLMSRVVGAHLERESLKLSPRKIEILELLAEGYSSQDIASELFLSPRTVDTHIAHLMMMMNSENRLHTVVRALQLGIIDLHVRKH